MIFISSTYILLALIIVFLALYIYKLKAKQVLLHQRLELMSGSHKDFRASVNYAKRIQQAMLPKKTHIDEIFSDYFIFFQPKDVVSGDFYYAEHRNGKIMFAVADCTGHGVPGALMSVLCSSLLSKTTKDMRITNPGEALDMTTVLIMQRFQDHSIDVKDGMDIALCSLDEYSLELEFAGACMSLLIVRNGEMLVYNGDKQSVGLNDFRQSFHTEKIQLQKGDVLYLATDGFPDQFGGEKGKKMKSSVFRKILIDIAPLELTQQQKILEDTFQGWKGKYAQLDDVCIFGVRV